MSKADRESVTVGCLGIFLAIALNLLLLAAGTWVVITVAKAVLS